MITSSLSETSPPLVPLSIKRRGDTVGEVKVVVGGFIRPEKE